MSFALQVEASTVRRTRTLQGHGRRVHWTHIEIITLVSSQMTCISSLFISETGKRLFRPHLRTVSFSNDTERMQYQALNDSQTRPNCARAQTIDPVLLVSRDPVRQVIFLLSLRHVQKVDDFVENAVELIWIQEVSSRVISS